MENSNKKNSIFINYFSVLMLLVIFYAVQMLGLNKLFILIELIPITAIIISFNSAFKKNGLWKLVHTPQKKLDEREIQIVHKAIRISYSIFVIICLALILLFAVAEGEPIDVLMAACLIYLAHTLPAAIIGWTGEEV